MSKLLEYKELVRELAEMLDKSSLSEIEVEEEDFRVRVARDVPSAPAAAIPVAHAAPALPVAPVPVPAAAADSAQPPADSAELLKSPMVGTAYLAPSPDADPFVTVGSRVKEGDTVLIIEAMKVMNQIPAHKTGVVTEIMVGDAQPVDFDAPLMRID